MTIIAIDDSGTAFTSSTMKCVIDDLHDCGWSDEDIGSGHITFYSATVKKLVYTPPKYELVAAKTKSK